MLVCSLGQEDPLEEEMATHSSILAWETPQAEEPGRPHTIHGLGKDRTGLSNYTTPGALLIKDKLLSLLLLLFFLILIATTQSSSVRHIDGVGF